MKSQGLYKRLRELLGIRVAVDGQTIETKTGRIIGYANDPELARIIVECMNMVKDCEQCKRERQDCAKHSKKPDAA
jgi:hypothetical protein